MTSFNDFGSEILGTFTDIVDGVGTNFQANATANAAVADSLTIKNQISKAEAQSKIDQREKTFELVKTSVMVVFGLIALSLIFTKGVEAVKKLK